MNKHAEITYNGVDKDIAYEEIINKVIEECFKNEKLEQLKLYVSITLTVPEEIKSINKLF